MFMTSSTVFFEILFATYFWTAGINLIKDKGPNVYKEPECYLFGFISLMISIFCWGFAFLTTYTCI